MNKKEGEIISLLKLKYVIINRTANDKNKDSIIYQTIFPKSKH